MDLKECEVGSLTQAGAEALLFLSGINADQGKKNNAGENCGQKKRRKTGSKRSARCQEEYVYAGSTKGKPQKIKSRKRKNAQSGTADAESHFPDFFPPSVRRRRSCPYRKENCKNCGSSELLLKYEENGMEVVRGSWKESGCERILSKMTTTGEDQAQPIPSKANSSCPRREPKPLVDTSVAKSKKTGNDSEYCHLGDLANVKNARCCAKGGEPDRDSTKSAKSGKSVINNKKGHPGGGHELQCATSVLPSTVFKCLDAMDVDRKLERSWKEADKTLGLTPTTSVNRGNLTECYKIVNPQNSDGQITDNKGIVAEGVVSRFICCTAVDDRVVEMAKTGVAKLGGVELCKDNAVAGRVTHIVMGSEKRTLKTLLAIANGAHFLKPAWITASISAGAWLPENDYRANVRFQYGSNRAKQALQSAASQQLLANCKVHVFGNSHNRARQNDIRQLVNALGAQKGNFSLKKCDICVVCKGSTVLPKKVEAGRKVIGDEFLCEIAEKYELPEGFWTN